MSTHDQTERRAGVWPALILALLAAGLVTAGVVQYRDYERRYRSLVGRKLGAVAELKVAQLTDFREELAAAAGSLQRNPRFVAVVRRFLERRDDADQQELAAWLEELRVLALVHQQCDRVRLLDARGATRLTVPASPASASLAPVSAAVARRVPEILRSGRVQIQDFYRDDRAGRVYLGALAPLLDPHGRPLAVLYLRVDPAIHLYPFVQRWPTSSPTSETLLVRRDRDHVLFLNDLRFRPGAALELRFPLARTDMPAVKAVLGQRGIVEGTDYRGQAVIAELRAVPGSPWLLVTRTDAAEAFAPLRARSRHTVLLVGALLLGVGAALAFVWRTQQARVDRKRLELAERLHATSVRQQALLAAIPDIVMEVDANKIYTWANRPGLEFFGDDVVGREAAFYFEGEQPTYETVQPIFDGSDEVVYVESWQRRRDGEKRLLAWWCRTLKDAQGHVIGALSSARDMTEQRRAEEALRRSRRELELRNEELRRFTYAVSHDLKSPLVTIKTFAGYLETDARGRDAARVDSDLAYIRGAADKMSRLLDELLELSRVGLRLSPAVEAPLQDLAREALHLVAGRVAERGVQVQLTEEPVVLCGDRPRLVEVFQNLIDNAVKFMGDQAAPRVEIGVDNAVKFMGDQAAPRVEIGVDNAVKLMGDQAAPRVEIGVEPAGGDVVLYVRDNGIGIDPRHGHKLFGLFEKLDSKTEGTGVGLALVRRIVEVHGGRIWAESAGLGQGATFRFTLAHTRRQTGQTD